MRDVFVIGVGMTAYSKPTATPYAELGLTALRAALRDGGVPWTDVRTTYVASALTGVAIGQPMLAHLGSSSAPIVHVENASASGSTAIERAFRQVASGEADLVAVIGVDKPTQRPIGESLLSGGTWAEEELAPILRFALMAERYSKDRGWTREDYARVAVKNHGNAALNPASQSPGPVSLEEVLESPQIAGMLSRYESCPVGEGAAAVLIGSAEAVRPSAGGARPAVRILGASAISEPFVESTLIPEVELTRISAVQALEEAGRSIHDVDVIELHDAFAVEELAYLEAMGISADGDVARDAMAGHFDIGGRCAVSPSGGLLGMGHPIGPTGVGQVVEIVTQLRGEAGDRQQPGARVGLAHMVGLGAVCVTHVFEAAQA